MKHFYFKNILKQITSNKKENLSVAILMIMICCLLTISNIISDSDQLENSLISSTDFRIQIVNDNIFSDHSLLTNTNAESDPTDNTIDFYKSGKNYLVYFLQTLDELSQQEEVKDYNYNLICQSAISNGNDKLISKSLLGVNQTSFSTNENIEMTSGRFFSQEELDNGAYKVIIPDNIAGYSVGDKLTIYKPMEKVDNDQILFQEETEKMIEVEIIGTYKADLSRQVSINLYDYFDNYNYVLIPNSALEEILTNYYDNIEQVLLNDIVFTFSNYQHYSSFNNKLQKKIISINSLVNSFINKDTNIHYKQQNYEYILYSIQRIKVFYKVIFTIVSLICVFILCWLIYYLLSNKIKEIFIYYSLGESKLKIILRYTIMYSIILFISLIIGSILGYFLSNYLQQKMIINSSNIQYDLLSFTDSDQSTMYINETLPKMPISTIIQVFTKVAATSFSIVLISVTLLMMLILKGNIRDKLQKGE